jgi:hypothetical protein
VFSLGLISHSFVGCETMQGPWIETYSGKRTSFH